MFKKPYILSIAILVSVYILLGSIIPPGIYPDSAWGFIAWNSFMDGSQFNYILGPSVHNIALDQTSFLSHWTPGQYFVPGVFMFLLNVPVGIACIITSSLCIIIGLIAYYKLFLKLEFSKQTANISVLIIACQKYASISLSFYNGGEVLLFAFVPIALYIVLGLTNLNFKSIIYLVLIFLLGFFLKATFLLVSLSIICFLTYKVYERNKLNKIWDRKNITQVFYIGFAFICSYLIIYFSFLSKGSNPSNVKGLSIDMMDFTFSLAAPLTSAFSLDDIINRIVFFPSNPIALPFNEAFLYAPLAIASLITMYFLFKIKNSQYRALLGSFYFIYTSVFIYFYCMDADISYEARHMRTLGVLLIPGIVQLLLDNSKIKLIYIAWFAIILSCVFGITSYLQRKKYAHENYFFTENYFNHPIISKEALAKIVELDSDTSASSTLLYTSSPEINLELKNLRLITQHADFTELSALQNQQFNGKVNQLYILLQSSFVDNGKQAAICKSFTSYNSFEVVFNDGKFILYKAN